MAVYRCPDCGTERYLPEDARVNPRVRAGCAECGYIKGFWFPLAPSYLVRFDP